MYITAPSFVRCSASFIFSGELNAITAGGVPWILFETSWVDGSTDDDQTRPAIRTATWLAFIVVIVGGIVVTIRILRSVEEEEDEYANWGQEGYQDSLTSTYQSVISAPTVPSGPPATVPTSMPPQAQEPPTSMPPQDPVKPVPEIAPEQATPPAQPAAPAGPPLPETGLPEGWTMEQWNAYGEMWLSQNQQN